MPKLAAFDPDRLHGIAQSCVGLHGQEMLDHLQGELMAAYPGHIAPATEWLLSNAGGCLYAFTVFHASISEYLLVFGTETGTQGHTGRHQAHVHDFVLDGELWYFDEDRPLSRRVHEAGDRYYLKPGDSQGLTIRERAWVLEYAQGFIPSMLPFGLADSVFSALDFQTAARTLGVYAKLYPPYLMRLLTGRARL